MAEHGEHSSRFVWFVAGAAIGAAIALLYAPASGRETRRKIQDRVGEGGSSLIDSGKEVLDRGRELYAKGRQIAEEAADLFERGRKLVEDASAATSG